MKFQDMRYTRPDVEKMKSELIEIAQRIGESHTPQEQEKAFMEYESLQNSYNTASTIASIHHTINTKDEFYDGENNFFDEVGPVLDDCRLAVYRKMLASPFREELQAKFGEVLFSKMEIDVKSSDPSILSLMQQENALETEYQKLYASAQIPFEGKVLTIPQLSFYKRSKDRDIRKAAYIAEGSFFDAHRAEFDELYDKMVQNRTEQAKALGYENYIPLGYIRMKRNGYGPAEVAAYREQVVKEVVPFVSEMKEMQKKRIGVSHFAFYDDLFFFKEPRLSPKGTPEEILASGQKMYRSLSKETKEFIDFMMEGNLFDVLSRDGKAPGGYCTYIPEYRSPFIFSNFNSTSDDIDVLTHEAGHAFAAYRAAKRDLLPENESPTLEACEVHSMSMEFLTSEYHSLFFGENTPYYELFHTESAMAFLPYGCMVDEFQHIVYQNPEMTPEERNQAWAGLEKKYRPYLDFEDLPFYARGAGWQRQLHIYECPFYYIDYCLAQTVAFQFWIAFLKDKKNAWGNYLCLVEQAGEKTFPALVASAGMMSPFEEGCLKWVVSECGKWIKENQLA